MKLRPYQEEALEAVVTAPQRGIHRPMVVLPTGMGKTVVFASIAKELNTRTLVLAHREELLTQAKDKIQQVWNGASVGIVQAKSNEVDRQVVVGSVQTLINEKRLQQMGEFGLIIVDEAHHAAAESYHRILDGLGSFDSSPPLTMGVTATPNRADGKGLDQTFQSIVYEKDILYGIKNGYLSDLRGVSCRLEVDFKKLQSSQGDIQASSAHHLMLEANAPQYAVEAYQQHAEGQKGIVFTPTVEMAALMAEEFDRQGIPSAYVSGKTHRDERRAILQNLDSGKIRMVANCGVLTEGFDQPDLGCIIIARPTKSEGLYIQLVGRGTRLAPGKTHCTIIDLVGASERHDLITTASLYGTKDGETIQAAKERQEKEAEEKKREEERMGQEETKQAKLVSRVKDLFGRSSVWNAYEDKFYLKYQKGTIWLVPKDERWHIFDRCKADGRTELVDVGEIEKMKAVAEKYVKGKDIFFALDQEWKKDWREEDATQAQINFLRWKGIAHAPNISKGQANRLIAQAKVRG